MFIFNAKTEKNPDLLDLIIRTSSDENSIVLDCFCGSGTTLKSAQTNGRKWIGIDQSEHAIKATINKLETIEGDLFVEKPEYKYLSVCGKLYPFNRLLNLLIPDVDKLIEGYKERAKKANRNGGIDWKAVSHAYRVIFQLTELCKTGTITFPLSYALQIKKIKLCKYDYKLSLILDDIADNITIVESLLSASTLPERVDSDVIKCIVTLLYKRF